MLRPNDRNAIEEPIVNGSLTVYRATPSDHLQAVQNDPTWNYHLTLENTATGKKRTLYFAHYRDALGDNLQNFQLMFDATGEFKPTWQFTIDRNWLVKLRDEWLNKWFETLGFNRRILRSDSKVFEWKVEPHKLMIRFEIDDDKHADKHFVDLPPVTMTGDKPQSCLLASMDLAPVLYNLSEIAVRDTITVSGNQNAVVFSYETAVGEFKVALPTQKRIDGKFVASKEHFSKVE
jgi:hypothetical protein